jgi:hypothetical protein
MKALGNTAILTPSTHERRKCCFGTKSHFLFLRPLGSTSLREKLLPTFSLLPPLDLRGSPVFIGHERTNRSHAAGPHNFPSGIPVEIALVVLVTDLG